MWVKDKEGEEAWVPGTVLEKSGGKPCKVQIEVDEEFSEEPLTFTFSEDDGEYIFIVSFCLPFIFVFSRIFLTSRYEATALYRQRLSQASKQRTRTTPVRSPPTPFPWPLRSSLRPTLLCEIILRRTCFGGWSPRLSFAWRVLSQRLARTCDFSQQRQETSNT